MPPVPPPTSIEMTPDGMEAAYTKEAPVATYTMLLVLSAAILAYEFSAVFGTVDTSRDCNETALI